MKLHPCIPVLVLSVNPVFAQGVRDSVVQFTSGPITLEGTLTIPPGPGPFPGAVIIAGSGPTDRDGNSPAGIGTDAYAMLAKGLAERGIASLRYDKRGLPSSKGTVVMATTTLDHFADDATAAAGLLAARTDIGPVVFIGHSEGGTLAMLAAADSAPVQGLVLVATAGRRPTAILREQLGRQFPPAVVASFDTAWAGYLRGDTAVTPPPALAGLFAPETRRFLQSWEAIDPVEMLARLRLPTMVLQGETDVQITLDDARRLARARPDVRLVTLPGVNHVLKEASGATPQAQAAAYTNRALPLAPAVVPAIADFIKSIPQR